MPPPARVWVLNLDAEHELGAAKSFAPSQHLAGIVARERQRLIGKLVGVGDFVLLEPGDPVLEVPPQGLAGPAALQVGTSGGVLGPPIADLTALVGLPGHAWSPTPRALGLLRSVGAVPEPAPEVAILRRVNARPFTADLRTTLLRRLEGTKAGESIGRGALAKHVASDLEQTLAVLAQPAPLGWLVRRTFGAAGRGRMRMDGIRPDGRDRRTPTEAERAWLRASLRLGPLVLEPWVEITTEFTRSAWLAEDGAISISGPCFQATTDAGAWTNTARSGRGEVTRADDATLEAAVSAAGEALHEAGYFGPFGVDAFKHRPAAGRPEVLNPLSEINARFTMDWTTAMQDS